MRYLSALLILSVLTGSAAALTQGAKSVEIWNAASYEWDIQQNLAKMTPLTSAGYSITYTNGPSHASPQGTVVAQFVQETLLTHSRSQGVCDPCRSG